MPRSPQNFRNIIICDDIREELGHKHSLMGVFSGDIVVPELPARIRIAVFMTYVPSEDEADGPLKVEIELLQDDLSMVKVGIDATIKNKLPANFVLPQAFATFDKECTFLITARVDGSETHQISAKKIVLGAVAR